MASSPSPSELNDPARNERAAGVDRIEKLLSSVGSQRMVLVNILGLCSEAIESELLIDKIGELQAYSHSIFPPSSVCAMLERAGAIERMVSNDAALKSSVEGRCASGDSSPAICWIITEAGRDVLAAYASHDWANELASKDPQFVRSYVFTLELCSSHEGATMHEVQSTLDENADSVEGIYASRILDELEKCGAVEWRGSWCITQRGRDALRVFANAISEQ